MRAWLAGISVAVAVSGGVTAAHHSIAGVYDSTRKVTIEGVVSAFQFINPHPFVIVDVTDAANRSQRWRLELDNRGELAAIGVTSTTLKPGDRVIVSGSQARTQANELYVRRLDRPADGFWYEQIGSSPKIR